MKTSIMILLAFSLVQMAFATTAPVLEDNFDNYTSLTQLKTRWSVSSNVVLDNVNFRSANNCLKLTNTSRISINAPISRIGLVTFSYRTNANGISNFKVRIGTNVDEVNEDYGEIIYENKIKSESYETIKFGINKKDRYFLVFEFENIGDTELFIDDLIIDEISPEAIFIVDELNKKADADSKRYEQLNNLLLSKSKADADKTASSYNTLFKSRIKTLGMLKSKTSTIIAINGFAASIGNYVQLSNPLKYDKYKQIKAKLLQNLNPLDTLFLNDEIEGRVNKVYSNINDKFSKLNGILNIAQGIGDMFTGGAVSKMTSGIKELITKGFSGIGERPVNAKEKIKRGVQFYNETKDFFEDIENQNDKTMRYLSRFENVLTSSIMLEREIDSIFVKHFRLLDIKVNMDDLTKISKNNSYGIFDEQIDEYFQSTGKKTEIYVINIAAKAKEIDALISKYDDLVKSYEVISSETYSIFDDLKKDIPVDCPYRGATPSDKAKWILNVTTIKNQLDTAIGEYKDGYIDVNFF